MDAIQQDSVDLQYEEVAAARTAVLNRELLRLRGEGWSVQLVGDHLEASRKAAGRSQLERMLIAVAGMLAIAFVARMVVPDLVAMLGISTLAFYAAMAALGAVAVLATKGQAAHVEQLTVGIDGQGRPFTSAR